MNVRTPAQETTIDAAVAHVDFLLQARRNAIMTGARLPALSEYQAQIRLAVVSAATAIIDEPKGARPVRTAFDTLVRMPPALRLVQS